MAKTKVAKKTSKGKSISTTDESLGGTFANGKKKLKPRIKKVSFRDEQIEGKSVSDTAEYTDPAIMEVRKEKTRIRYTAEELYRYRDSPFSKKKPDFFEEGSAAILDPERWNADKKKSESQSENGGGRSTGAGDGAAPLDQQHPRRRPGDPRERVRKENDGIVLSPQRRSFNSGCFVPVRGDAPSARSNRSHSPLGGAKNDGPHMGIREIQSSNRRIGSGRILRDSWDFGDKPDSCSNIGDGEYNFRGGPRCGNNNEREDKFGPGSDKYGSGSDKYERRSFGRDFEMGGRGDRENNNKEPSSRRNGRFDRRRMTDHREQEPEWFSGGPVSQNDTIELRGFEDTDKPGKKKLSPSRVKRAKDWSKKKIEIQPVTVNDDKEESKEPAVGSTPTPQLESKIVEKTEEKVEKDAKDEPVKEPAVKPPEKTKMEGVPNEQSFNFEDILKCDSISGLLTNGIGNEGDPATKSRFSQFFKQDSPEKAAESRRSSMHDDHHIIKNLLKDIGETTSVAIPGDSEAYFAPISPAANTGGGVIGGGSGKRAAQANAQPINIMEMLQRGKQPNISSGKILSLDELEAKMRQDVPPPGLAQKHHQQKPDEEMAAAFKKLLAQAQVGGHTATSNGPINKAQPMSLLEMLNHSQQQDEVARLGGPNAHLLGPTSPNIGHHLHGPNDLTMKQQQVQYQQQQQHKQQMDMLNKLINSSTSVQMRGSPLHDLGVQQSRELLNRPEAQAILHGLKRGEITTQHVYQQLSNPALQPRHREMLMTILKMQGTGYGPSPRALSPQPPHHMFQQQQQQQLRVSPLPPNALHQRIPSPRELQVHTQNILQRALIKKKLEEQQENYRKKQEMQRGQSPSTNGPAKSISSPTPLAFTPTSVLRKMTADKDEGKENKLFIDGKIPPGRPLTGVRPLPVQPPQGQQWNQPYASVKHPGRPIVKANNYQGQTAEQFFSQHQQQQQQQRNMFNQPPPGVSGQRKPGNNQGGLQFVPNQGVAQSQYNTQQYSTNQQFTQQQLRAQHQHRPSNQQSSVIQQQQQQQQQRGQQLGFQQQQQQQGGQMAGQAWQQFFSNGQGNRTGGNNPIGRAGLNDGDLSPTTTNQLARWFSPDLLERARGGELPSTAGLAQHALSLEELERRQTVAAPPAVHN
ncbi:eukaryotic translation initiation factor 4E transporter isoform X2 [Leptinotarsa decemlineata]|uniref:eukaryotic translation initiation factor 4E transporter isoform X2 n=1 Tax=Leptinotarsa decemlineata TaxID=7539 RepID=UPI003D304D7A